VSVAFSFPALQWSAVARRRWWRTALRPKPSRIADANGRDPLK
jgi:hypothetical protein